MNVQVYVVSAFTAHGAGGNKAGVVLDAGKLSDNQMLRIANALGFSETAFVSASQSATQKVRFFTPTEEVDLCGHATIAAWSLLHRLGLKPGTYSQETPAGTFGVLINDDGTVFMQQAPPRFLEKVLPGEIAPCFGMRADSFQGTLEPRIVTTGLKDLMVPVATKRVLNALQPDYEKIAALSERLDITGLHVFTLHAAGSLIASVRNFAPRVGINEESATGTSNGALLCYLKDHGRLTGQPEYCVEQGETLGNRSFVRGKFIEGGIWVGGSTRLLQQEEIQI